MDVVHGQLLGNFRWALFFYLLQSLRVQGLLLVKDTFFTDTKFHWIMFFVEEAYFLVRNGRVLGPCVSRFWGEGSKMKCFTCLAEWMHATCTRSMGSWRTTMEAY